MTWTPDASHVLVVDLEATCSDDRTIPPEQMETIEIGAVLVRSSTFEVEDEYQAFVRPVRHPVLLPFCTRLTGITQTIVDGAPRFSEAFDALRKRLVSGRSGLAWGSWGRNDERQLKQDCALHRVPFHMPRHINLKTTFAEIQGVKKKQGMAGALALCGLKLEGSHHRGIDDARNIARMLPWIVGTRRPPEGDMTRIAIISDVHADVHALRDALASIERLGCDQVICAGDLVDYGLFPEETLRLLIERRIPCIRGNHDRWAASRGDQLVRDWDVSTEAMNFVRDLPTSWRARIEEVRVVVWHARPGNDMAGIYPDISEEEVAAMLETEACDVLVVGHTHLAFARRTTGGRMICNPGALLRDPAHPMDQAMLFDPESGKFIPSPAPGGGSFGVIELPSGRFTVRLAVDGAEVSP